MLAGQLGSVLVRDSVASPSGSGLKSAVSEPLDHVGDFEAVWDEIVLLLKNPPKQFALKSSSCSVVSDSEFTVARVLDGAILRTLGKPTPDGKDGEDLVRYSLDKARGSIRAETFGRAGLIRDRDWCVLHRAPALRLEWWGEAPGARKSSSAKSNHLQAALEAILAQVKPGGAGAGGVRVLPDAPSVANRGLKSAVSAPLDDLLGLDELWHGYVRQCKAGAEVEQTSLRDFTAVREQEGGRITMRYHADRQKRLVYAETYGPKGGLFERRWTVFHQDPLRLECWGEAPGERKSGKAKAMLLQNVVDGVIAGVLAARRGEGSVSSRAEVHANVPSLNGSGQLSVLSEPLDALASFPALWDRWLDYHKRLPGVAEVRRTDVTVASESEFKVVATLDEQVLLSRDPSRAAREDGYRVVRYSLCRARGTLYAETCGREGRVRERNFAVLHRNPLRLEWWGETPGERKFGAARGALLSAMLEAALPGEARAGVETGVPSVSSPALKSALSEPLDGRIGHERLWAELVSAWRNPRQTLGVRFGDASNISEREFELPRVDKAGESTLRYTLSPAEASARIETLGSAGRVRDRNWAVLHRSPLRLEVWGETPGERKHGPLKSASVQELVNEILSRANPAGAQIKVSHGVASPSVAGLKSVMSEPMDHVISYDRFWKELVGLLQDPVKSAGGIKDSSIRTGMGPADEEFAVVEVLHPPPLKVVTEYKVNKAQGWVYSEAFGPDGELQEKGWAVFHGAPLRLECWSETHTVRKFGPARRDPMQYLVNAIMKRVAPAEAPGAVKVSTNAKLRCVVSGDMGKRIDFERLWRELIHVSMHPQRNATMISSEVTRTSDTEFIVVQTLQSGKGKGKGKGKGGKGKFDGKSGHGAGAADAHPTPEPGSREFEPHSWGQKGWSEGPGAGWKGKGGKGKGKGGKGDKKGKKGKGKGDGKDKGDKGGGKGKGKSKGKDGGKKGMKMQPPPSS